MNKTINQYINQLHLDPKREAAVRKLFEAVASSDNSGGSNESPNPDTPVDNEPEFIDLGLPSGTLWCSCNLGAKSPEEHGNFYQWGDTKPYHIDINTGEMFDEGMNIIDVFDSVELCKKYIYATQYDNTEKWAAIYSKYNALADYGDVDFKFKLDASDDVARLVNPNWRMPNFEEIQELIDNTRIINTPDINGMSIFVLESLINGKTIMFPSLPYDYSANGRVLCWSNILGDGNYEGQANGAYCLAYSSDFLYVDTKYNYGDFDRFSLSPVRPIKNGNLNNSNYINIDGIFDGYLNYETFTKIAYGLTNHIPIFDTNCNNFVVGRRVNSDFINLQLYEYKNKNLSLAKYTINETRYCTKVIES